MKTRTRVAVALLALVVAACGGTAATPAAPTGTPGTGPATPTPAPEPVTISFWADPSYGPGNIGIPGIETPGDYEQRVADAFMAIHPNVTVTVQINNYEDVTTKTTAAIAAGTPPDIIRTTAGRIFDWNTLAPELVYDLRELLTAETLAAFPEDFLALGTARDGKLYSLQAMGVAIHNAVNRNMLEAAGLEYPADGFLTRAQFEAMCEAVVTADRYCFGHQFSQPDPIALLGFVWASGGDILSADGTRCTINAPEFVETLAWMLSLDDRGWFLPGAANLQYEDPLTAHLEGRVVAYASSNLGQKARLQTAADEGRAVEDWSYAPFPIPRKDGVTNGGLRLATTGFGAFRSSDNPAQQQAVRDFLEFNLDIERNSEQGYGFGFPARSDATTPPFDDPQVELVAAWVQEFGFNTSFDTNPDISTATQDAFTSEVQAIWLRQKTPQEGLDVVQGLCEEALAAR